MFGIPEFVINERPELRLLLEILNQEKAIEGILQQLLAQEKVNGTTLQSILKALSIRPAIGFTVSLKVNR